MLDLSAFNDEQKQAVLFDKGPAAIIASPGSGKTRVIVYRIINLMEQGVKPQNIWACTFTKKAAGELQERLHGLYGEEANKLNISTLHSSAYGFLKRFENRGNSSIRILKGLEGWMFFDKWIKANPKNKVKDIKQYLGTIGYWKLELKRVEDVRKDMEKLLDDTRFNATNMPELSLLEGYEAYQAWLNDQNKVDFADMLMKTYYHMSNPKNASKVETITEKIDYLLVDEAQDANKASFELYKLMGQKFNNIMMCGDPKQAIYGFQGSKYTYLYDFVKQYNARVIDLPLNYRSTSTIINHSNKLIQVDPFFKDSVTVTNNHAGEPIHAFTSMNETEEAVLIADAVETLHYKRGYKYSDIAVLYRVNAQAIPITDEFAVRNIPFFINTKNSYYKRKEIQQIVAYIKIITDPHSASSADYKLISNAPTRYIKGAVMDSFMALDDESAWQIMLDEHENIREYNQLRAVKSLMNDVVSAVTACYGKDTRAIAEYVLKTMGFERWLNDDSNNTDPEKSGDDDKQLNVEVLLTACAHRPNPTKFVEYAEQEAGKQNDASPRDAVRFMSMHSSKGLEFPVVFISGVCDRMMPYFRADTKEQYMEERRIAYVGATRAKERLFLSTIDGKYGRFNVNPSEFVRDMGITPTSASDRLGFAFYE